MSEPSAAPTPSFRGRGRGRGRSQAVRAHVARLAQQRKAANGRRGRQKLYDHPKPQAASERLKELKAAFSTVANALRPALEDLADRNLDQLKSQSSAYRAFQEYQDVKAFLDGRHRQVQAMNNNQLVLDTRLKDSNYETSRGITETGFIRDCEDANERFYDAQLLRLDILEKLHDNELPIDIVDNSWNFREISDERFRDVKAHIEYRTDLGSHLVYGNKVEVPCAKTVTGRRIAGTLAGAGDDNGLKPSPKRKADGEPDILPPPKRLIGTAYESTSSSAPRHIGGLLSAVVAPTDEDDDYEAEAEAAGSPGADSKVPSPSPALAEEEEEMLEEDENGTPVGDEEDAAATYRPSDRQRLPPLPNGASEPDAFGVRLINKRRTANFDVYNRILVPALFDFEPHEIGFRDSTNDKSRGATKVKRGRFLDTPNSNTMHFDRSLWQYDATTYEDSELDEELVKKHSLHPKHGLFLRSSVNDEEPPKEHVSGKHPIVFYTPRGRTFNSSRSIRVARLEDGAQMASKTPAMAAALDRFAEQEGVEPVDIRPPEEMVEDFRQEKLKLWLGPRRVTRDETEEQEERIEEVMEEDEAEEDEDRKVTILQMQDEDEEASYAEVMATSAAFGALLDAAATVDTEVEDRSLPPSDDVSYAPMAVPASSATPPPPRRAASRPFDPVRDVFMDQPLVDDGADRRRSSTDYIPPASTRSNLACADASSLLYMAHLASDQDYISTYQHHQPPPQQSQYHHQQPPAPMRYPPPRAPSHVQQQQYPPVDPGPVDYPPPPPRRMSMDPPQPYHHQPQPQHSTPQQQHQLLDPRLFGESAQQHQQLPPPDVAYNPHRRASNSYSDGGYYQQQQSSFLHTALQQGASLPPPGPPTDHYGQPPPPSAAYGQQPPSSHSHHTLPPPQPHGMAPLPLDASPSRGSQYYMSPPPQHQQVQPQHTMPMMRPYQNSYAPLPSSRAEREGSMPPPGIMGQQGLPPPPQHMQGPPPYQQGPPPLQQHQMMSQPPQAHAPHSPQIYAGQPPAYARGGSREYQPHNYQTINNHHQHHQQDHTGSQSSLSSLPPPGMVAGRGSPPPLNGTNSGGDYQQQQAPGSSGSGISNGSNSNNNNKYRKLEPAPMMLSRSNEWSTGGSGSGRRDGGRGSVSSNSNGGTNTNIAGGDGSAVAAAPTTSEGGGPGATAFGTPPTGLSGSGSGSGAGGPSSKELRTVPYDYEKIKDYAAVEPPPSHGPKAIRGWAHNNMKRGKGTVKSEAPSEWDREERQQ